MIGRLEIKSSGGWQTWNTQTCKIEKTNGKHDIYFVAKGGEGYLFNINWWRCDNPVEEYITGDLNGDRIVNVYDYCEIGRVAANGGAQCFGAADINGDDAVNETDMELLRKFIMNEIDSFN